jgi:hypothetical protein
VVAFVVPTVGACVAAGDDHRHPGPGHS